MKASRLSDEHNVAIVEGQQPRMTIANVYRRQWFSYPTFTKNQPTQTIVWSIAMMAIFS